MNSPGISILGAFVVCGVYAVFGNVVVYITLVRHGIPVRFMWAGTPGYLYRICATPNPALGPGLRRFALSTNIAFVVAMILGVSIGGFQHQ